MAGYSGTPLAAKLGIKPGAEVHPIGAPAEYRELLAPLPEGVTISARLSSRTSIVHIFSTTRQKLTEQLKGLRTRLGPEIAIWVSWPKKAANVPTDVTEDVIRQVALPLGYVDIKVCAVSEVWSGLKLVVRKELR